MKYNRADINDTIRVAQILANETNKPRYVFPTGCGWKIDIQVPPFAVRYHSVNPDKG